MAQRSQSSMLRDSASCCRSTSSIATVVDVRQLNTYGFSKVDSSGEGSLRLLAPRIPPRFPSGSLIQRKSSHRGHGYGDDALSAHVLHPVVGDASAPPPIKTTDLGHAHELQSIFSSRMEGRIGELQEQVKATKMQQVDVVHG